MFIMQKIMSDRIRTEQAIMPVSLPPSSIVVNPTGKIIARRPKTIEKKKIQLRL